MSYLPKSLHFCISGTWYSYCYKCFRRSERTERIMNKQNAKNEKKNTAQTTTKTEEKNAQVELSKVKKQIRTGVTGGWRVREA